MIAPLLWIAASLFPLRPAGDGNGGPDHNYRLESSTVEWNVDLSDRIDGRLLLVERPDGALIVAPLESGIAAFDAVSGKEIWRRSDLSGSGMIQHSAPLLFEGPILAWTGRDASGHGIMEVFSALDGRPLWTAELPVMPIGRPLAGRSGVGRPPAWFIPAAGGQILILDNGGKIVERVRTADPIIPPLLEVGGSVVASVGADRRMMIIGALSQRRARRPFVGDKAAVFENDIAYSLGARTHLLRCRTSPRVKARCRHRWEQAAGASMGRPLFFDEDRIFVPSWDSFIYAFRRDNGHMLWKRGTNARPSHLTRLNAHLFISVAESSARVDIYHAGNGAPAGDFQTEPLETLAGAGVALRDAFIAPVERPPIDGHFLRRWRLDLKRQD